jgi:hypothetical protein
MAKKSWYHLRSRASPLPELPLPILLRVTAMGAPRQHKIKIRISLIVKTAL